MKKHLIQLMGLILALSCFLPSCSSSLSVTEEEKTSEAEEVTLTEEEQTVEETVEQTEEKTETEEEKKEQKPSSMQKKDPALDDTVNVLMIGNSFCYFYVDELYEMAKAAGIKMRVCNLYYSGCKVIQHWNWWEKEESNYKYVCTDDKGRRNKEPINLKMALRQENWDIITLQQHFGTGVAYSYDAALAPCLPYTGQLFDMLKKNFPMSKLYWHQTWAYEVGYNRDDGPVRTAADQATCHNNIRAVSHKLAQDNGVPIIPSGDAWAIARANPAIGDVLCVGTDKNNGAGDHYHDGDTGGGQYLNACTWFEVLTGKSCIGNSFRPSYDLSSEKIAELQKAAHQAVAALYGEGYAK